MKNKNVNEVFITEPRHVSLSRSMETQKKYDKKGNLIISALDGPYGPMTNTEKDNFSGG